MCCAHPKEVQKEIQRVSPGSHLSVDMHRTLSLDIITVQANVGPWRSPRPLRGKLKKAALSLLAQAAKEVPDEGTMLGCLLGWQRRIVCVPVLVLAVEGSLVIVLVLIWVLLSGL